MKKLKITLNGRSYEVDVEVLQDDTQATMPFFPTPQAAVAPPPMAAPAPVAAPKAAPPAAGAKTLTSPMNGVVLEIPVKAGDTVKSGQVVVILEAMKMKTNITSPQDGKIASVNVSVNDSVESGQVLLTYA